ncbi:MAG TPA: hypothetical protein VM450_04205 [Thermomicrobiales bacterium]|nr:hypothetical protein [Thermomicrobiales bacterium]
MAIESPGILRAAADVGVFDGQARIEDQRCAEVRGDCPVEDVHVRAKCQQAINQVRADEPGAACHDHAITRRKTQRTTLLVVILASLPSNDLFRGPHASHHQKMRTVTYMNPTGYVCIFVDIAYDAGSHRPQR